MRLRRRWQTWVQTQQEAYHEWHLRRTRERRERLEEERHRMLEDQAQVQAMARAVLTQLNAAQMEALTAELRTQLLDECQDEARALARQELSAEADKTRERLEDRYAKLVEEWQDEIERRIEDGVARGTRDLKDELEDTITELKGERQEASTRAQQAEGQLTALVTQLLPLEKRIYLYNAGLRELSLTDLNAVLGRSGLVVKSRQTYSERQVKCQIAPQRYALRSLFWLDKATAPGVVDEDEPEADGSNIHPHNASIPERLALPEGPGA